MNEPIKVRWHGKARDKCHSQWNNMADERGDSLQKDYCLACDTLERQKGNVVIKSEEEAHALLNAFDGYVGESTARDWMTKRMDDSMKRVVEAVKSEI